MSKIQISVEMNQGKLLVEQIGGLYGTIPEVVQEMVQNAIDAGATRVETIINLKKRGNQKKMEQI